MLDLVSPLAWSVLTNVIVQAVSTSVLNKIAHTHYLYLSCEKRLLELGLLDHHVFVGKHSEALRPIAHDAEGPVRGFLAEPQERTDRVGPGNL